MKTKVLFCRNPECKNPGWERHIQKGRLPFLCPICTENGQKPAFFHWPDNYINNIICGDCLSVMRKIPDAAIDMILCDLPYGITNRNKWDVIIPFAPLWRQYNRIIKPTGVIALTATQPFASELINTNIDFFRYDLIWVKNKSTGFLNANKMPLRSHESILIFYKNPPIYSPQKTTGHKPVNSFTKNKSDGLNYGETKLGIKGHNQTDRYPTSVLDFPVVNNDSSEKIHPTQKPVALFEYLIKTFSNEGDTVLDSCIGSGTTAVACKISKRNFIGIELDMDFCKKATERIRQTVDFLL